MKTQIGITKTHRKAVAGILSRVLADEVLLYTKTKNAHWNVEGRDFYSMHTFFEVQYGQLDEMIDRVAERIRALGHYAPATMKSFLELTHLTEMTREKNDSEGFIKVLLSDHESIIMKLRESVNPVADKFHDSGTSDFITGLMEEHEKMAWILRAHLSA
jgi:starvation-inducible DNA-binding protein